MMRTALLLSMFAALAPDAGSADPVFFQEGFTKPTLDLERSANFKWTERELTGHASGLVLLQCVLTAQGRLLDCRVLRSLRGVEDVEILQYAAGLVYHPARRADGTPVALKGFTIPIRLQSSTAAPAPEAQPESKPSTKDGG